MQKGRSREDDDDARSGRSREPVRPGAGPAPAHPPGQRHLRPAQAA